MQAKLGQKIVEVWQVNTDKPSDEESWVLDAFKHRQLSWSGQLVMAKADKQALKDQDMAGKAANITEAAWSWLLLYTDTGTFARAFPYDIYLVVNQVRIPAFAQLGDYLVQLPGIGLEVYSPKKAKKELTFI